MDTRRMDWQWFREDTWLMTSAIVLLLCAGATFYRNSVWGDSLGLWSDTAQKSPHKIRPLINTGMEYRRRGKNAQAEGYFREAMKEPNPQDDIGDTLRGVAATNLTYILIEKGDYTGASDLLKTVLDTAPTNEAWNAYGLLALILGRPEISVEVTSRILDMDDTWRLRPSLWATRGQAFQALRECGNAEAAYVTLKALNPKFEIPVCD